ALRGGRGEAAIGVRGGSIALGSPGVAAPVDEMGGRSVSHALPPDAAVGFSVLANGESDVGEDCVAGRRSHGVGVGFDRGAGGDAEEAGLGIDGAELAMRIGLDPGDVVADGPYLPALEAWGRDEHGEVGLAAGGGERAGDIRFFGL